MTNRIYISGPMSGYPDHNFPAFLDAEKRLREMGFEGIANPARCGQLSSYGEYMRRDIAELVTCSRVVLLPGWRDSKGARLEVEVARICDVELWEYEDGELFPLVDETLLEEAARITAVSRNSAYGHPRENFSRTIDLWNGYLSRKLKEPLTAEDFPRMMILVKIARLQNGPHRDSLVDIAGYANTENMLGEGANA